MKRTLRRFFSFLALLVAGIAGIAAGGCKTTDASNESAIPWNQPRDWEHGLPSGLTPGSRY